ncbi:MAG: VacJ family lipoprotein [Deltaproteobacteria bacterium]|nr:MAG: VacJ family lipoprotein [Deltaproteobacteria bacterium]
MSPRCVRTSVSHFFGNLLPDRRRQRSPAGQGEGQRLRRRPLRGQHHRRGARFLRSRLALGPDRAPRGLRADARRVGRADGAVPRAAAPRAVRPARPAGFAVDYALAVTPFFIDEYILVGARVADTVNERSFVLKQVEDAKASAFDYYTFVRNAYLQRRRALVCDLADTTEENQQLYYPELDREEKP